MHKDQDHINLINLTCSVLVLITLQSALNCPSVTVPMDLSSKVHKWKLCIYVHALSFRCFSLLGHRKMPTKSAFNKIDLASATCLTMQVTKNKQIHSKNTGGISHLSFNLWPMAHGIELFQSCETDFQSVTLSSVGTCLCAHGLLATNSCSNHSTKSLVLTSSKATLFQNVST